jgi:hypothetical protein
MFLIRSGEVEIERNGKIIETLGSGGIFGEMALIDGSPRSATARAKTDCVVAPINEKTFPLPGARNAVLCHRRDADVGGSRAAHEPDDLRLVPDFLSEPRCFCPFHCGRPRP